jgi:predicted pyridoxine 5'-phosphate oxidase superfamily flavin-nucleotide-binding protein
MCVRIRSAEILPDSSDGREHAPRPIASKRAAVARARIVATSYAARRIATTPVGAHGSRTMAFRYHEGELAVQERAGTRAMADKIGNAIHGELSDARRDFLASLRFVILGALDASGRLWATARFGEPGFLRATGDATVRIDARAPAADPLAGALDRGAAVGLLAIDLETRRRLRLNGTVVASDGAGITVETREVFGNCPKYIQVREVSAATAAPAASGATTSTELTADVRRWLAEADTFFLATRHPERGVDVSHRGGHPRFIRPLDDRTLEWPDYAGNGMFQSLGNLAIDPLAGLLFIDFEQGRTLHLVGAATVDWSRVRAAAHPGAERVVVFEIAEARELAAGSPLRFRWIEESPFNPR